MNNYLLKFYEIIGLYEKDNLNESIRLLCSKETV